jgi:multidrug efflux system membrane fusion protein
MRLPSIASSAAALTLTAFLAGCGANAKQEAAAPPPTQVTVSEVSFKALRQWDELTGRLEAIDTVEVRPRVGGYINGVAFQEGARVNKGQVLFQIDPRPFQAEADRFAAEVDRSKAKLDLARANLVRGQRLIDQNALAQSEFERLQAEEKGARADLAAAGAALQAARLNLEFTRVVSPIDGRISKALITRGNLVTTSDLLTTVVSDSPIYASFNTDEQTYLKYAAADRGKASPVYMGLMGEDGYPHQGKLQFLDNAMDAKSGTINGRAIFDNRDGRFTPGLFARIRLVSDAAQTVALAPDKAIGADLGKRYVMVVGAGNKAEYRAVTLGPVIDGVRIIRQGLNPGDVVIVGGLQKVKPGDVVAPVKIKAPVPTAAIDPLQSSSSRVAQAATASLN